MDIKVKYDGEWPNLCSGHLELWIDGVYWDFGKYRLSSGGHIEGGAPDWDFEVFDGPWDINDWPDDFPEDEYIRANVIEAINAEIAWGCCGGCI